MGIRLAVENRKQYSEDGARLAEIITHIDKQAPADSPGNKLLASLGKATGKKPARVSSMELPDAHVTTTIMPLLHGSGEIVNEIELHPDDVMLDRLGVSLLGSTITHVYGLRATIPGDHTSGHQTLPIFSSVHIEAVDALRYGAGDTPAIIANLLSRFGDL